MLCEIEINIILSYLNLLMVICVSMTMNECVIMTMNEHEHWMINK